MRCLRSYIDICLVIILPIAQALAFELYLMKAGTASVSAVSPYRFVSKTHKNEKESAYTSSLKNSWNSLCF